MGFFHPVLLSLLLAAPADTDDDSDDAPVAQRPTGIPWTGARGNFKTSLQAYPTTLPVESTVTLIWQVRADKGRDVRPPRRVNLQELQAFTSRFYIEDARPGDERRPAPNCWEFVYRLKPRRPGRVEVPDLPLLFFNPALRGTPRPYQVVHTDPIVLTVEPPPAYPVPLDVPERLFSVATGPGILAAETPWTLPRPPVLAVLLLASPVACGIRYLLWRRRNPRAARLAGLRRSRAARDALHRLRKAAHLAPPQQAALAASALAGYLRERFDLPTVEPTPLEASQHLYRAGYPGGAAQLADFLKSCDAARFGANGAAESNEWAASAGRLILAVEEESCPPPSS